MENSTVKIFSLKLISEVMPVDSKYHKYLNRDSLMLEIFSMTQQFIKSYKESDSDECLEIYAQYITDLSDILTLGDFKKIGSKEGKILLDEAIDIFLKENGLEK